MKCRVCGALLEHKVTDLPFKIGDSSIVVLKALPVLECRQCGEIERKTRQCVEWIRCSREWTRHRNLKSSASPPEAGVKVTSRQQEIRGLACRNRQ